MGSHSQLKRTFKLIFIESIGSFDPIDPTVGPSLEKMQELLHSRKKQLKLLIWRANLRPRATDEWDEWCLFD